MYVMSYLIVAQDVAITCEKGIIEVGPNFLRCTTKDKKDLVFNEVLFCPIF